MRTPELQSRFEDVLRAQPDPERVLALLADYPEDDDADAIALGGDALMRLGRYEEALGVWRALATVRPGDARAAIGLAALGAAPPLGAAAPAIAPLALPSDQSAPPAAPAPAAPTASTPAPPALHAPAPARAEKPRKAKPAPAAPAEAQPAKPKLPLNRIKVETTTAVLAGVSLLFLLSAAAVWFLTLISVLVVLALAALGLAGIAITASYALRQSWRTTAALAFSGVAAVACLGFAVAGPLLGATRMIALAGGGALFLAVVALGVLLWSERAKGARAARAA